MDNIDTVVYDAAELVVGPGRDQPFERYEDAAIAVVDGTVARVGDSDVITREYPPENATTSVDASGKTVVPGFVDSHTHAVFAGDRSDEFEMKLLGRTYQEILAEGGGILRTVRATRAADEEQLLGDLLSHLDVMLAHGTTTVEVKSGYGLDVETELRMLSVVERANERHAIDIVPTFMGAHAVPEDREADTYVHEVVGEQLPAVADQGIAEFCDIFCEEGVFSVEQSRCVLEAGKAHDLRPKVHAEELTHLGGSQLAAAVGAVSADHLLYATQDDISVLAEAEVVPVLLPGTAFSLGAEYADARAFLEAGVPVAVATDFSPNCHTRSMSFAMALSCAEMRMTPAEALVAATRNAALAIDRSDRGTLADGATGDFVVIDAPSHVHVPYSYGENLVDVVVKDGVVVHDRGVLP